MPHLSARERELLALVMEGLTNREIAARTRLQEQTVKNYLAALCRKLDARNRVQLAVAASRLLSP
jgi:DNA-binding CsgD family transcriptional regulator